jgi:hypothetical protein
VKEKLTEVIWLRNLRKKGSATIANEILNDIPDGAVPATNLEKLAKSLEAQLFRVGGYKAVQAMLVKLLKRSIIQLVLPEGMANNLIGNTGLIALAARCFVSIGRCFRNKRPWRRRVLPG